MDTTHATVMVQSNVGRVSGKTVTIAQKVRVNYTFDEIAKIDYSAHHYA